jgi:hypothetical protein
LDFRIKGLFIKKITKLNRRCGLIEWREGFVCRYRPKGCQLRELKTADIGLGFLLKNQGFFLTWFIYLF